MSPPGWSARPLVIRCGALGDMVLLTALIRVLVARYRQNVDVVTSGPWSVPLLRGQPGIGDIYSLRSRKTPYFLSLDQHRVVRALQERGWGPTWFCDGNDAARPLLRRAGIPEDFVVYAKDHDLRPGEHATEQWRRLAQLSPRAAVLPAEVPPAKAPPADLSQIAPGCELVVGAAQWRDLAGFRQVRGFGGRPYLALQIGNKRTMRRGFKRMAVNPKYWPTERWAAVMRYLRVRHPQHTLVLLGTGPESALNEALRAMAEVEGVVNVADDLDIPRLVAVLARADGLITVDSGPAHVAAAVGCPQVTLFGKASTALYRPWGTAGADVRVLTGTVAGQPDMLGIETAAVIAAWETLRLRAPGA